MKNYVQKGDVITVPAPSGGVESGDGVLIGTLFGVALSDAAATEPVPIQTTGVVELPKTSELAIAVGDRVFWIPADGAVNKTATSQVNIGVAVSVAGDPSPTVLVKLGAVTASGE